MMLRKRIRGGEGYRWRADVEEAVGGYGMG